MRASISILAALLLVGAMVLAPIGAAPATAQSTDTIILRVDRPNTGDQLVTTGWFGGWAIDQSVTTSPGIRQLAVFMDGDATNGKFLGLAQLGGKRPDVAAQFGNPAYAAAGWNFSLAYLGLTGQHSFTFVATGAQGALSAKSVDTVTLPAPLPSLGSGPPPFVPSYGYGYGYGYNAPWYYGNAAPWSYGYGYRYSYPVYAGPTYVYPWNYSTVYPYPWYYTNPTYYYPQPSGTSLPQTGGTNLWSGSGGTPNVPPVNLPQYAAPTSR